MGGISDAQRENTLAYLVVLPICGPEEGGSYFLEFINQIDL